MGLVQDRWNIIADIGVDVPCMFIIVTFNFSPAKNNCLNPQLFELANPLLTINKKAPTYTIWNFWLPASTIIAHWMGPFGAVQEPLVVTWAWNVDQGSERNVCRGDIVGRQRWTLDFWKHQRINS